MGGSSFSSIAFQSDSTPYIWWKFKISTKEMQFVRYNIREILMNWLNQQRRHFYFNTKTHNDNACGDFDEAETSETVNNADHRKVFYYKKIKQRQFTVMPINHLDHCDAPNLNVLYINIDASQKKPFDIKRNEQEMKWFLFG